MKQINNTTFISDNLGDLKPLVTIGGKPVDKFIPNLNMSFHNDEFFINLNRRDKQAVSTTDKAEIDGIDKDIFYVDENGRFKWDIEFKERPSKNSWTWELKHAEGIEFYYQGELTPEEISDGCERPLEVVGSYAAYCNKANNKYKTGKLCHIYRPFCYDINAESIYADLKIADEQLTITIDEAWLDNASYPVRLDPTIGYTTAGALTRAGNYFNAIIVNTTAQSAGVLTSLCVYTNNTSGVGQDISLGVYNDNGSNIPGTLFSGPNILTIPASSPAAWRSMSGLSGTISSGTKYFPALRAATTYTTIYYDAKTSGDTRHNNGSVTMIDNPSLSSSDWVPSLYLEYTTSGGSSLPAIINNYRQQGVM